MITAAAGRRDQRITLQRRVDSVNSYGENVPTWQNVVTTGDGAVWASAETERGRKYFAAAQLQAVGPVAFRILWLDGVHERMRVLWRGESYEIAAPPEDVLGKRTVLDLFCVSGIRDGR
jgi:SPP1 family predicted phage head-tail adaptor